MAHTTPSPAASSGIPKRVLIIDDNADVCAMLSLMLSYMGHETRVAHGGEEGLRIAEEFAPTFVLLDLGMPGLDGFETCGRMRQQAWAAGSRIVAFTGWSEEMEYVKAREVGFDGYVLKPIGKKTLNDILTDSRSNTWLEYREWLDRVSHLTV